MNLVRTLSALFLFHVIASVFLTATAQSLVPLPPGMKHIKFAEDEYNDHTQLQNLILNLHQKTQEVSRSGLEVGRLNIHSYTYGTSNRDKTGILGRFIPHLLPFQTAKSTLAFESFCDISYQWPGDMHLNTVLLNSNHRRKSRNALNKLYQAMLPIYSMDRHRDYASKKSFVLPFYDEGLRRYKYGYTNIPDSTRQKVFEIGAVSDTAHLCGIRFEPVNHHHTLLNGYALVDTTQMEVVAMQLHGNLDLAKFDGFFLFSPNGQKTSQWTPHSSDINIAFHYLNSKGSTHYHTLYKYIDYLSYDSLDRKNIPLDLTPYYDDRPTIQASFDSLRPIALPCHIDSLIYQQPSTSHSDKKRNESMKHLEEIGGTLFDGTRIGTTDNQLRIYGPLDPASLGYDKFNGVTLRERSRYNARFSNGSIMHARGEIGYAFRLKELRWKLHAEWIYNPRKRGEIDFETRKSNSTFSSKFINTINDALKEDPEKVKFDSLGIDYYQRYEFDLHHSIELSNGLSLRTGILHTYRVPVRHGVRKATADRRDQLIDSHYADFAPYIRIEYTPRQYYWYNEGYKEYIDSPSPSIAIELARAIPGAMGSESNYGRAEFDMHQLIPIGRTRNLGYHVGAGKFFNRTGEYFINYNYFARSAYPETWEDDRIGGTFCLLDDYWYSSSPSYLQAHLMYETPFGFLHKFNRISRFVIKERVYLGALWAEGKSLYNEVGYGIDNNYFNVGCFIGFKDANLYSIGFKFRIEIGRHI